ncbi:hypothetical protein ACSHWG_08655 [Leucobacter sp. Z1108]
MDPRDYDGLRCVFDAGVAELGRLEIVSASAGFDTTTGPIEEFSAET